MENQTADQTREACGLKLIQQRDNAWSEFQRWEDKAETLKDGNEKVYKKIAEEWENFARALAKIEDGYKY